MHKFNETVAKLKRSQAKLSLLLFPDIDVIGASYANGYIPASYTKNCTDCYFENIVFTGDGDPKLQKSNWYFSCSINGIEFSTNDKPQKPIRLHPFFTVYPGSKVKHKTKPSGNRKFINRSAGVSVSFTKNINITTCWSGNSIHVKFKK